ncbi:MAG: beta-phosphoglucomutase family hydrolase [Acidobacteriota bacterium]
MEKNPLYVIRKETFDAVIFDMDGVVTRTAGAHAAAWKRLFDEYLREMENRKGIPFRPFDIQKDYLLYVDGKPRYEGVQSFIESRGLEVPPRGNTNDVPGFETVCSIGNRKNRLFHETLEKEGVEVYASTMALIRRLRALKIKTAVVTSSKNGSAVLEAAGIGMLFDSKVDGLDAERLNLPGKPNPDMFTNAAQNMEVTPARSVVVEDAIAGVQAGKRGNFGLVIGVDRAGQNDELLENGADIVVKDLSEVSAG